MTSNMMYECQKCGARRKFGTTDDRLAPVDTTEAVLVCQFCRDEEFRPIPTLHKFQGYDWEG